MMLVARAADLHKSSTPSSPVSMCFRRKARLLFYGAGLVSWILGGCDAAVKTPAEQTALEDRPRVRVLGTVQDGGLPHAACSCENCEAARHDTKRRRQIASLAIVSPASGELHLVDATPDIRNQLDASREPRVGKAGGVDRTPVDGVLLTHAHVGHYTGLAFFGLEAINTRGLPVFCSRSMAHFLRQNGPWNQLVLSGNIVLREVVAGKPFPLTSSVEVTAVTVPHRDEFSDTLGFVIRGPRARLLYVPDADRWDNWEEPLLDLLADVDIALLDGTFYSPLELPGRALSEIPHPLIPDSMELLEPLVHQGQLRVFFTHLNHSNLALDPHSAERGLIDRRGFGILAEGQEFPL